jgi:uncharacterized membrane protein YjfL (UPF0719 family)
MKTFCKSAALAIPAFCLPFTLHAAESEWHAKSLGQAILYMVIFALIGIALAIIGYKLFDYFTPGDLHKEIIEHRNLAAGLIGAAIIIGTCILVGAAMMG